jgi:hypothetical protein
MLDFNLIQNDLIKIGTFLSKNDWKSRPNREFDGATKFIYNTRSAKELAQKIIPLEKDLRTYAARRWYNYKVEECLISMMLEYDIVKREDNKYHKTKDIYINQIPFDIKTCRYPKTCKISLESAMSNKRDLIKWLYSNQSKSGRDNSQREHYANRLFVIYFDSGSKHELLKSNLALTKNCIDLYLKNFQDSQLTSLPMNGNVVYSDIIFVINDGA